MRTLPIRLPERLGLARVPTPLQPLQRLGRAWGVDLWCKRDDLTGFALSGNKIRKLDLLLADARRVGADTVITCGGIQSNHARTTALAAARVGMRAVLLLRGDPAQARGPLAGNLLLDHLAGAEIHVVDEVAYADRQAWMTAHARHLEARGHRAHVVPEGGSTPLGALAYVAAAFELAEQMQTEGVHFDAMVTAVGSGGTLAGLAVAHAMDPTHVPRPVGVPVCEDAAYFRSVVAALTDAMADAFGTPRVAPETLTLIDGFVGPGYARNDPASLQTIVQAARTEGLLLDPVYTGKAATAIASEAAAGAAWTRGRILLWHTGGVFALLARGGTTASPLRPTF